MMRVRVNSESGLKWATLNTGTCNIIYEKENNIQPSCVTHLQLDASLSHNTPQIKSSKGSASLV